MILKKGVIKYKKYNTENVNDTKKLNKNSSEMARANHQLPVTLSIINFLHKFDTLITNEKH
jgi:hypothetical protein